MVLSGKSLEHNLLAGLIFLGCSREFLESIVGELLLRAPHAPSDHTAQLLHCHTVSAGWGALILSVKQMHSLKPHQADELVCLSVYFPHKLLFSSFLPKLLSLELDSTFKLLT